MSYTYKATNAFWKNFYALDNEQKKSTRDSWDIFKKDPFDPRLKTHKIQKLSAIAKTTVWAVEIEGNLRAVFQIDKNVVTTLDIGTHEIYK